MLRITRRVAAVTTALLLAPAFGCASYSYVEVAQPEKVFGKVKGSWLVVTTDGEWVQGDRVEFSDSSITIRVNRLRTEEIAFDQVSSVSQVNDTSGRGTIVLTTLLVFLVTVSYAVIAF